MIAFTQCAHVKQEKAHPALLCSFQRVADPRDGSFVALCVLCAERLKMVLAAMAEEKEPS